MNEDRETVYPRQKDKKDILLLKTERTGSLIDRKTKKTDSLIDRKTKKTDSLIDRKTKKTDSLIDRKALSHYQKGTLRILESLSNTMTKFLRPSKSPSKRI